MEISKKIIKRINVLYCFFFVVILVWIAFSALEVITTSDIRGVVKSTDSTYVKQFTNLETFKPEGGLREIPVEYKDSSLIGKARITAYIRHFDASVELPKGVSYREKPYGTWYSVMNLTKIAILASLIVVAIILVTSFRKGVKTGELFSGKLILMTRLFGFLMIASYFVDFFNYYFDLQSIKPIFANTGLALSGTISIQSYQLLSLFFVFFVAEILAVSRSIFEEEKMTI